MLTSCGLVKCPWLHKWLPHDLRPPCVGGLAASKMHWLHQPGTRRVHALQCASGHSQGLVCTTAACCQRLALVTEALTMCVAADTRACACKPGALMPALFSSAAVELTRLGSVQARTLTSPRVSRTSMHSWARSA